MKKDNRWLKMMISIIVVVVLLLIGVVYYINNMRRSLWNQTALGILEVTSQCSHTHGTYIERDRQMLIKMGEYFAKGSSNDVSAKVDAINSFENEGSWFTVIDLDHGIMYAKGDEMIRTVSKEELEFYETFAVWNLREPYIDEYTGQKMIGCYQYFTFADGVRGVVQIKRPISMVTDEFILSFYDNRGFSYVANKNGDILIRPSHKNSNQTFVNVFDMIKGSGNSAENIQIFQDALAEGKEGVMRLAVDGADNIFAYVPVSGTDGWYFITIVPDYIVMKHTDEVLKSSQIFFILLISILIIAALFFYTNQWSHKKILEKEDDIQYREYLFDILANNTNDVFLMFSPHNLSVEYVSPNVERVLGFSQEEIKNNIKILRRSYSEEDEDMPYRSLNELEVNGMLVYEGERIHGKSGESRWFMETILKTEINHTRRYIAVLSDRTHERQSEQALRDALQTAKVANESKSTFLSSMSHDIRTPMNAIVGFTALLQRDAYNPEKVLEYTKKIISSSQYLLSLINDVLDMSRIESGKATLNISEISLANIVKELGSMIQSQARAKEQEFKIEVYNICNEEVLGDQLRINQVLINILSNAIKYTPVGGKVEMVVRQLPQHKKNYAHYRFTIKDNGIGMSQEYLENIFQPFTREDSKKTLGIQGTGLGMAITKNLVDLMGGTLEIESEADKGSTFTLDLELRIKEQDVDRDFWKKHGVANLLVVDDEEETCLGIQNIMADTGVHVKYAIGGLMAVQMTEEAKERGEGFDLVLIDWQMPDIDGVETARRIRKIVSVNVPIMILTAYDIDKVEAEGLEAGIDGFLQKPFFLSSFRMIVDNLLKGNEKGGKEKEEDTIFNGLHILAAEDIEINAELLMELLGMVGAHCDIAYNGQEVLEKFETSAPDQYDVILMDVQMPIMNGYEATRAIRECSHSQAKTIPIIAMTANAFSEDVKAALDAGMDEHVAKPIDMDYLEAAIKAVFTRR